MVKPATSRTLRARALLLCSSTHQGRRGPSRALPAAAAAAQPGRVGAAPEAARPPATQGGALARHSGSRDPLMLLLPVLLRSCCRRGPVLPGSSRPRRLSLRAASGAALLQIRSTEGAAGALLFRPLLCGATPVSHNHHGDFAAWEQNSARPSKRKPFRNPDATAFQQFTPRALRL